MTKVNFSSFWLLLIVSMATVVFNSCGENEGANKPPACSITNPQNNAQFNMDEAISVTVVAEDSDGTIAEVQLYVDNVGHSLKETFPYNFTINAGELTPGTHTLKAVAKDNQGAKGESTVSITINQPSTESPDFISFSDGKIPNTWQTTAWSIDNTVGFDDIYSLKAVENGVAVVTSKTFDVLSYVEFYTTGNNFYFYIDGVRSDYIQLSNTGNWQKWIYAISQGAHTFKWETTSASKLNLDAIKFAPSVLPEVHTIDVTQRDGYSVTVNYILSSNGNNAINAQGVCWSVTTHPTVANNKTTNVETLAGSYTSVMENLLHNTTYYVRAYASNGIGTVYGEELSIETSKSFVGDHYQGGIVVYVDATRKHGLIAAPEDQSVGIQWYNGNWVDTGATDTAMGTGKSNTTAIIQVQGTGIYAAKICDDLVLNGYDDWYLPSKDELNMLYQNRNVIEGFSDDTYWSSSEIITSYAWYKSSGYQNPLLIDNSYTKDNIYRVRAVRSF